MRWKLTDGRVIDLIREDELRRLPKGTRLVCIDGTDAIVGEDEIDLDTRGGYLAFGILRPVSPDADERT